MHLLERLHTLVDKVCQMPGARALVEASYVKSFIANRDKNLFHGVYDSFEAADAQAKKYGVAGYDNEAAANMYLDSMRVTAQDYPAMFWLNRSFQEGMHGVFDVGGSIGIKYYAFAKALPCPPNVRWTVEDVPAVVARGKELAVERGVADNLGFTDKMEAGDGHEVLYASGALQYLPRTLPEYLAVWSRLPRRIIINTTPIHPEQSYFTVNSIGTAFCPYRIQTQLDLVRGLSQLGFKMRDHWLNVGKNMQLPMHPQLSLPDYSGFCFDLAR